MKKHRIGKGLAMAALMMAQGAWAAESPAPTVSGNRLVLLGTGGGPGGRVDRSGIATLLEVGGHRYLIDAGGGVSRQLALAGVAERDVPLVFLTHLHDDHYAGLLSLASFGWSTRGTGMQLLGPAGTVDLAHALGAVMEVNARIRNAESGQDRPVAGFLAARDLTPEAGFADGTVSVKAIANSHYTLMDHARAPGAQSLSYRFDMGGKAVVFTGDTGPMAGLAEFARGADVLVAEMATAADRAMVPPPVQRHMDVEHLSPAQVGDLATQAGVRKLVLSHVGKVDEADLAQVRAHYAGPVVLGRDLQSIAF
ncbi:MBL fold metallo-hydrolase [Novosphingobium sediminicola]|uniref:Ribonuclease BN (tRNA processing enzyme) n=1 Tax=Novosphingobium sediminicola TaxID=563162 RepID=A0A7W6G4S4_9SPHN|nr:MBL fold metallo-hydrolase [Novosphingobium sediminicola]MBB3953533.1 ribonuclease BN (tRNA processing enzyme) [Novosphingobium sediminicola]